MYSEKPTPFYLSYPLPYDTEEAVGREWEILKSWYSDEVLQMQEAVERACDELDYEGSWIYDEYPDRGRMEREQLKIQKRLLLRQEERNPLSQESGKGQGGLPQKNGQRGILQEDEVSVETAAREKEESGNCCRCSGTTRCSGEDADGESAADITEQGL